MEGGSHASPPACQGPDPSPRPASFAPPPGSIDTHFHVFENPALYPYVADRSYTPAPAPLSAYRHLQERLGLTRGVLVQPSVYGTDNRLLRTVLALNRNNMRGIAVVGEDVSERELAALNEVGVRGIRLNLLFRGGPSIDAARRVADRIADLGWHLQLLIDVSVFPDLRRTLGPLPVPLVFDHFGHMPAKRGITDSGFQDMLGLLKDGKAWVKLSGAYRITARERLPYDDVAPLAEAIFECAPSRAVWGSDWPHPAITKPMPNDGELLDLLTVWAPDESLRAAILRDNPEKLYGFDF